MGGIIKIKVAKRRCSDSVGGKGERVQSRCCLSHGTGRDLNPGHNRPCIISLNQRHRSTRDFLSWWQCKAQSFSVFHAFATQWPDNPRQCSSKNYSQPSRLLWIFSKICYKKTNNLSKVRNYRSFAFLNF